MHPELVENVISDRFSKYISYLIMCRTILKLNELIWICLRDDRYLIAMCWVRGVTLGFSAIAIKFGEGKYKGKFSYISRIIVARGIVPLRATYMAMYSASEVDKAISVCNLLCQ
jgi:hypothetical protein